jgi:GAF domain-containing protein
MRVAAYGPPLTNLPDETSIEESPLALEISRPAKAVVEDLTGRNVPGAGTINVTSLLLAPIRIGDRVVGVIAADRNGEPFRLNQGELDLAQAMANVAALELDSARNRQMAGVS